MNKLNARTLASATGIAVTLTLGLVGTSSAASAAPAAARSAARSAISPSSCQSMPLELRRVSGDPLFARLYCAGRYGVNHRLDELKAGPWSGQYQSSAINGPPLTYDFCDGDDINLGGDFVHWVYLSPTKEPWCR
jgi:hypothetical protein